MALALVPTVTHIGNIDFDIQDFDFVRETQSEVREIKAHGRGKVIPPTVAELKEISCLATMIYGEARGETAEGKVAVAYSAINRSGKKTVCEVVLAPKQYSIFNNNPALREAALSIHIEPKQKNIQEVDAWEESMEVATKVIQRVVPDPTNGATHYLAPKLMKTLGYAYPRWALQYKVVAVIDNHTFYKQYYPRKNGI
jgi:spore germination cell wall hydrolase CwlJ-like protein